MATAPTATRVIVNTAALANDYDRTYSAKHGCNCHASDWQRVRDAVIAGCPDLVAHLIETPSRRYLFNPMTGWQFDDPAPGTFRSI